MTTIVTDIRYLLADHRAGIGYKVIPAKYLDYSMKNSLNTHSLYVRKSKVDFVSISLLSTLCLIMVIAGLRNSS